MIEELINYRKVKVEIIWDSETGMVIPSSAIKHGEDDIARIYVINGKRAIETQVNVLLEAGGQAVIESETGYSVILYDAIAKNAENVNKNKMIISN